MIRALQALLGRTVSMRNRSSKVFGAVITQLIEVGKIKSLDDPASLYLHRAPLSGAKAAITL
jgi:CubicO group peptidase (beta-lactamase class C family)